ncbi:MAG: TIGR04282 family arsenosugar biosynthesis glycosyltransferase [Gammaproteobacteria bacterium]|nr:TIGR04282 family arsenosugar biosynthesis glycosyltransferase [Gammaproteobacteria bacterium]
MTYKYPDVALLVFCKAPVIGQVKTRLMPQLNAEQAVNVHIELTERTLSLLDKAHYCPIQLWCSPYLEHPFFEKCVDNYAISLHLQQGNDLGERMHHAINTALESSSTVLIIGCDCPSLTSDDIEFAITALQAENEVVIAPAEDGGYVMIGMRKAQPHLFLNMTWGHEQVFEYTHQRIKELDLMLIKTRKQWDVDTFDDLQRYRCDIGVTV